MGGFQEDVLVDMAFACAIPGDMSFDEASVLPLGLTTAHALFNSGTLGLPRRSADFFAETVVADVVPELDNGGVP